MTSRKALTPHQRLAVGADWLRRKVHDRGFNMDHWYTTQPGRIPHLRDVGHDCHTKACAAGWMALCPRLIAEGLTLAPSSYQNGKFTPSFGKYRSWTALENFFGLTARQGCRIFDPSTYPVTGPASGISVEAVIRRIDEVLAELDAAKASGGEMSSNREAHDAV